MKFFILILSLTTFVSNAQAATSKKDRKPSSATELSVDAFETLLNENPKVMNPVTNKEVNVSYYIASYAISSFNQDGKGELSVNTVQCGLVKNALYNCRLSMIGDYRKMDDSFNYIKLESDESADNSHRVHLEFKLNTSKSKYKIDGKVNLVIEG